jgi:uncharacterized membrane protein YgdD (TMEM256/DUF423 family)
MQKVLFFIGCLLASVAVILGAFGAHALKTKLEPEQLQVFETGVRYQMYHAVAIILVAFFYEKLNPGWLNYSGIFFIAGIIFFSGSLYLLANKNLLHIEGWKFLGPITPLGGLCFIIGWLLFAFSALKK